MTMNSVKTESNNLRYKKKYKYMKMKVKDFIIENAALCDEVARVQENIQIVKEERKFLLCKLLEHEHDAAQVYYRNDVMPISNGGKTKSKIRRTQEDSGKT